MFWDGQATIYNDISPVLLLRETNNASHLSKRWWSNRVHEGNMGNMGSANILLLELFSK